MVDKVLNTLLASKKMKWHEKRLYPALLVGEIFYRVWKKVGEEGISIALVFRIFLVQVCMYICMYLSICPSIYLSIYLSISCLLLRTHMQDLKDVTQDIHYENFRAQRLASGDQIIVKDEER